jgi:protein-disulfide isomerase
MRNIWQYVVGGVVVAGAVVVLVQALDKESSRQPARAPSEAVAQGAPAPVVVPRPEARFEAVPIGPNDLVQGKADAPVTMVEYASLTCPHCAALANNVMPRIKKEYVETGKVRFVYRDFPLDQMALYASMFARCGGNAMALGFIETLFSTQMNWATSNDPMRAFDQIGRLGGLAPDKVAACLRDEKLRETVLKQRLDAEQLYRIGSTPTLIINGEKFSGDMTYEQLKAVLDARLPKG